MNDWHAMNKAPHDGTWIQASINGHGFDNIIAWQSGFLDKNGNECSTWCFMTEQEPPYCWTDGICWESNEDGVQSTIPIRWKPLLT